MFRVIGWVLAGGVVSYGVVHGVAGFVTAANEQQQAVRCQIDALHELGRPRAWDHDRHIQKLMGCVADQYRAEMDMAFSANEIASGARPASRLPIR